MSKTPAPTQPNKQQKQPTHTQPTRQPAATPSQPKNNNHKKKKKPSQQKRAVSFVLVFCILFAVAAGLVLKLHVFADYTPGSFTVGSSVDEDSLQSSPFVRNILLIGQDSDMLDTPSRSDTMLLISLDTASRKIRMVSFLRDTYCEIPGYSPNKLNAACMYGGPSLLIETLEYNYNIRIDGYARVGFNLLSIIVDVLGGVTIPEIDETEAAALYAGYGWEVEPGTNIHLNGTNALRYCRIRQYQSDFSRTERQREVLTQLLKDFGIDDIYPVLRSSRILFGRIDCSYSEAELLRIAFQALYCLTGGMEQQHIPADGTWWDETINSQSVLQIDWDENRSILHDYLY